MALDQELISKILGKLEALYAKQAQFNTEINALRKELYSLKTPKAEALPKVEGLTSFKDAPIAEAVQVKKEKTEAPLAVKPLVKEIAFKAAIKQDVSSKINTPKSSLEKRIGENILNKIGIVILVIGVAIGAKYTIENELISPITRIILGYIMAIGLLGFGIKLKQKFESYSAVLVSGAIVILYFITFFAYSFYDLLPQVFTFVLMLVFTAFAVVSALSYNKQVIALIGLVGAYAVPFLLSNGSGQVAVLFSYMAVINCGILVISFKKHWKALFYAAFAITWLIYGSWFFVNYTNNIHFTLALVFLTLFFLIFYITFLAYKLVKKDLYVNTDVFTLLCNSFLFFGFGYAVLNGDVYGQNLLGVFTVCNAIIHFGFTALIYKKQLADKNLFYQSAGLVLVFITIAIPIQLDGNWVTLLWIGEAALLFWIGRTKGVSVYEKSAYILMLLAVFSIIQDHKSNYFYNEISITPLFNVHFLSSAVFILAFAFIRFIQTTKNYTSAITANSIWLRFTKYAIPTVLLLSIFMAFRLEIEAYFTALFYSSELKIPDGDYHTKNVLNYDILDFKSICLLMYALCFMGLLYWVNFIKVKNHQLYRIVYGVSIITVFVFLTQGLYVLSELRDSYLTRSAYYTKTIFYIVIRYISLAFLAFIVYSCYHFIKHNTSNKKLKLIYDLVFHMTLLWVLSSELIQWMVLGESEHSYKLGLSILWGVYSFVLIAFGIWKSKQYLRIGGMLLFGLTLVKLFVYDISHLNTISKTIVFVALGLLLLIISFLYNKYNKRIEDDQ